MSDYKEALLTQKHLAFLLGSALIKAHKNLFKFGYLSLAHSIKKAKQEYKDFAKIKSHCIKHDTLEILKLFLLSEDDTTLKRLKNFDPKLFALPNFSLSSLSKESLKFIFLNLDEIQSWLSSDSFRERYLDTKHPYPPLLDPDKLNAVYENKANLQDETSKNLQNELSENLQNNNLQDTLGKNSPNNANLKNKPHTNSQLYQNTITPYQNANLSYEKINANIAWDLNLPLPYKYDVLYLNNGASASVAILRFFRLCGLDVYAYWTQEKELYKLNYKLLLSGKNYFNIIAFHIWQEKFFHLLSKKSPLLYIARDPISKLKSSSNHTSRIHISPLMKKFNLTCKDFSQLFPKNNYWGETQIPQTQIALNEPRIYEKNCFDSVISKMPQITEILYFDFESFLLKKSYEGFYILAERFHLKMPKDTSVFHTRAEKARFGLGVLPVCLVVDENDIGKKTFDEASLNKKGEICIYIGAEKNLQDNFCDLTLALLGKAYYINESEIIVYTSKDDEAKFKANKILFDNAKAYIKEYLNALEKNVEQSLQNLMTEEKILQILKADKNLRLMTKCILDKELTHLKTHRPDIVASWKYYQEFEKMCEED